MKKLFLGLLAVVMCLSSFKGKAQDLKETGDFYKDIELVNGNIKKINEFSFTEIVSYSETFQKICFNSLTPENKARIWLEKIERVITIEDNNDVKTALEELKSQITTDVFANAEAKEDFKLKGEKWMEKYVDLIGFDDIKFIVNTLAYARGGKATVLTQAPTPGGGEQPHVDPTSLKCECSQSSSFCGSSALCRPSSCDVILSSCGWFWSYDCNGRCKTY